MISTLYGTLLQLTPPSRPVLNAAHDWTLRHIESLVHDILVNIPNKLPPSNPYTEHILLSGIKADELNEIISSLVEELHRHSSVGTRIEQVAKGVA